jgi:Fur family ferric uptake transcriptional regulator
MTHDDARVASPSAATGEAPDEESRGVGGEATTAGTQRLATGATSPPQPFGPGEASGGVPPPPTVPHRSAAHAGSARRDPLADHRLVPAPPEAINVDALKENFVKFLRREGLKNTPERHLVLEIVANMEQHFDVDQLCAALHDAHKRVSKATVYRTVELLVKGGFIKRVIYGERQARYEWNYQVKYHEHLICTNCQFIFEFYNPELERLKASIAERLGFRPRDSHVEIRGICRRLERDGHCRYYEMSQQDEALARGANRVIRLPDDVEIG